jgi:hypothetical protein
MRWPPPCPSMRSTLSTPSHACITAGHQQPIPPRRGPRPGPAPLCESLNRLGINGFDAVTCNALRPTATRCVCQCRVWWPSPLRRRSHDKPLAARPSPGLRDPSPPTRTCTARFCCNILQLQLPALAQLRLATPPWHARLSTSMVRVGPSRSESVRVSPSPSESVALWACRLGSARGCRRESESVRVPTDRRPKSPQSHH